jgi:hypothetical protein
VQEDVSNALVWMYSFVDDDWTAVARVDSNQADETTTDPGESSGIIDMSAWLGDGWWALDVQAHQDLNQDLTGIHTDQLVDPSSTDPLDWYTWSGGPIPPGGAQYRFHREKGQLLFMYVPGS